MTALDVRFFDGRSSRPHVARMRVEDGVLTVEPLAGEDFTPISAPCHQIRWP